MKELKLTTGKNNKAMYNFNNHDGSSAKSYGSLTIQELKTMKNAINKVLRELQKQEIINNDNLLKGANND